MKNTIELVKQWAIDKGIIEKATPLAQWEKTQEELNELHEALVINNNGLEAFVNSKGSICNTEDEIKDAIGDIIVTLIIQAQMNNIEIEDCLNSAYDVISKRTGKMIDGKFVKDK